MKTIRFATLVMISLAFIATARADAPAIASCPTDFPPGNLPGNKCYAGQDANGAYYIIVMPANWDGILVLQTHGGPTFSAAKPMTMSDLLPAAQMLKFGWAVAGSSYRDGGFHVRMYAEDTENVRRLFVSAFGHPKQTIISGISFGAVVANKVLELYSVDESGRHYDGGMQACGSLSGVRRTYYQRLDARVVYQHYCGNLPRMGEAEYPLVQGLPMDSSMTTAELRSRVNDCTGILLPAGQRLPEQKSNLANILGVIRVPEFEFLNLMSLATFGLRELSAETVKSGNALPNSDVVYDGSTDDATLNAAVERYDADRSSALRMSRDSDPTGRVLVPVLTIHSVNDGIAVVEHESAYREAFERAGTAANLQQIFVDGGGHSSGACGLNPSEFIGSFDTLSKWIRNGVRPDEETIAADCEHARVTAPLALACRIHPRYQPAPYESRVRPRSMWSIPDEGPRRKPDEK
jgi:hypothetical protein